MYIPSLSFCPLTFVIFFNNSNLTAKKWQKASE